VGAVTKALVLGGGGVAGIAWECGVVDGLRGTGVDLGTADVLIGTSAGSVVGTLLGHGSDLEAAVTGQAGSDGPDLNVDMDAVMAAFAVMADESLDPREARRQVGELALATPAGPEERWVAAISRGLPVREWPERRLLITAVDTATGRFTVWDRGSGVPLDRAIASSCAVPCVAPPVTVDGSRYMDGGVRSGTNADLARGASAIVVLDPMAHLTPRGPLAAELEKATGAGGGKVAVIEPDSAAAAVFGVDVLSATLWLPAYAAGRDQAAALAPTVAPVWV
jgi:NTE family protein